MGLNCPIKWIVIIWLDQSGCTLYFRFKLTPASNLAGRIALQFYQRFLVLQLGGLINFFKHVICNKQVITCYEPDIVFIHSFLIPYRSLARRLARSRYGIKLVNKNAIRLLTCNNLYIPYHEEM